ncbi:L-threonylcarbamoyladenylate synthase [Sphingomonas sp. ID0503]|uniref:L-threonylcarbamoyladenylate synthase n=1 Tax=Sphingomonas sp. ID0503 TaxID=3399691 RepID=UPI003AFA866C
MTRILPFGPEAVAEAAALILGGQPVALPTETVYGLAADATDAEAVARIYAAKGRPSFNPLIVHVPELEAARRIASFDARAEALAATFWPGPLTLVLPARADNGIARIASANLPTVAIRVPVHPAIQAILKAAGRPLAAPSANASGRISPTRAEHVRESLDGRIPLIVDAGPTGAGVESTILAVRDAGVFLLRPGPVTEEDVLRRTGVTIATAKETGVSAPGQLASHYAPRKPVRLDAEEARPGEWLIGFGAVAGDESLSPAGDPVEAAARLFDALHRADAAPGDAIAVAPVPEDGLGLAINDRLRRAAVR